MGRGARTQKDPVAERSLSPIGSTVEKASARRARASKEYRVSTLDSHRMRQSLGS